MLVSLAGNALDFAPNEACKACHVHIYDEYSRSMHAHSTIFTDPVHSAVWAKHPKNLKKQQYVCGKCHTPAADNLDAMLTTGALPDVNNPTHNQMIACAYCHRIKEIKLHPKSNTNILDPKEKHYYGTREKVIDSPFHAIANENNDHIKNGNVCIGCHSHKQNKWGLNVCSTNIDNQMDGANCVSCHMPQVKGTVSVVRQTETHAFHGFPGAHADADMLSKYIDISMVRNIENFTIHIDNQASHALLLHPLRLAKLKVTVVRGCKIIGLKDEVFVRIIGKNGKPAMPWQANQVIKNTMIQGNEKRAVPYAFKLQGGDKVKVTLGYYLVNPKAVKKLGLSDNLEVTRFYILKEVLFEI